MFVLTRKKKREPKSQRPWIAVSVLLGLISMAQVADELLGSHVINIKVMKI